jgi:hypothetical protein
MQNTGKKFFFVENSVSKMKCLGTWETYTITIHHNRKILPCCKIPITTEAEFHLQGNIEEVGDVRMLRTRPHNASVERLIVAILNTRKTCPM